MNRCCPYLVFLSTKLSLVNNYELQKEINICDFSVNFLWNSFRGCDLWLALWAPTMRNRLEGSMA